MGQRDPGDSKWVRHVSRMTSGSLGLREIMMGRR